MDDNHKISNVKSKSPSSFKDAKEKLNKPRKKILKENESVTKEESAVFFGQVPIDLLRDSNIALQPKAIYALLHSYSQPKALVSSPKTFVSQKKLAKDAKISISRLRFWIKNLEDLGWLTVKRRGLNKSNY